MNIGTILAAAASLLVAGQDASDPVTIGQKNRTFSKPEITVKVGEKIRFENDDAVVHNVFSSSPGHEFNLKTQKPGQKSELSFDKEGTVEVRCAIHPTMKLRITVSGVQK